MWDVEGGGTWPVAQEARGMQWQSMAVKRHVYVSLWSRPGGLAVALLKAACNG